MANVMFDNPPILRGQAEDQLQQLYSYLGIISNQLNEALMSISVDQLDAEVQASVRSASTQQQQERTSQIKELIIKTANIVRTEMTELRTELITKDEAISEEFGTLLTNLNNQVVANAEGISQNFTRINTIINQEGQAQRQWDGLTSYINVGVVGQEGGKDIIGVAIGEQITKPDGTLDMSRKRAVFTKDRLSFYQGDFEIGYFASNKFYITSGSVTDGMQMGNHTWKVLEGGALALIAGSGGGQ